MYWFINFPARGRRKKTGITPRRAASSSFPWLTLSISSLLCLYGMVSTPCTTSSVQIFTSYHAAHARAAARAYAPHSAVVRRARRTPRVRTPPPLAPRTRASLRLHTHPHCRAARARDNTRSLKGTLLLLPDAARPTLSAPGCLISGRLDVGTLPQVLPHMAFQKKPPRSLPPTLGPTGVLKPLAAAAAGCLHLPWPLPSLRLGLLHSTTYQQTRFVRSHIWHTISVPYQLFAPSLLWQSRFSRHIIIPCRHHPYICHFYYTLCLFLY